MLVLITYDVSTETAKGKKRLRHISQQCLSYGQRVQNSVFECVIDYGTFLTLQKKLLEIYCKEEDSLRFYMLGNNWHGKVEHFGVKESYDPEGFLLV